MQNELKIIFNLDLSKFKSSLQNALKLEKAFMVDFNKISQNIKIDADSSELKKEIKNIEKKLKDIPDEIIEIDANTGQTLPALKNTKEASDNTKESFKGLDQQVNSTSFTVAKFTTAWHGAFGILSQFKNIINNLINPLVEYEAALSNINSIANLTDENLAKLDVGLLKLSKKSGKNVKDLADATYQAVSAGIDASNSLGFLETASQVAIAGISSTETAVDGLTTVLNSYKMKTEETNYISDLMFQTVKLGKTTFNELAQSYAQVTPIAAANKVSFDELSAAIATQTKQGTQTAVAIRNTRQAIIATNEVLGDGWSKTYTLQEAFQELQKQSGGSQTKLREMVGSVEALNSILALTGQNTEMATKDFEAMKNSNGSMAKAFEKNSDNLKNDINKIIAKWEAFKITILKGISPVLASFFDFINDNSWIWDSVKAGLILTTALIAVLTAKFLILNATMLLNPFVLIAVAAVALCVVIGKVINSLGGFSEAFLKTKKFASDSISSISQFISNLLTFLKDFSIVTIKILTAPFRAMIISAQNAVQIVADLLEALKNRDWKGVKEAGKNIGKALQSGFAETGEDIEKDLAKMGESFSKIMPTVASANASEIPEPKQAKKQTDTKERSAKEIAEEKEKQEKIKALREYYAQTDIEREYKTKAKEIEASRNKALAEAESLKAGNELKTAINAEYDEKLRALNEEKETEKKEKELEEKAYYDELKIEELELEGMEKEAEMLKLDEEYIAKREKYAGNKEILLKLEQNYQKKRAKINTKYRKKELTDLVNVDGEKKKHLNDMFENSKHLGKEGFEFYKKTQIANAVISTYTGAQEAYKSLAGIPIVGPALGIAAAAAAIAAGMARVKSIQSQKMEKGGLLRGKSHSQGGIPIEAEGGEYIINKKRVGELGRGFFDFLNFSPAKMVSSYFREKVANMPQFRLGGFVNRFSYETGGMVTAPVLAGGGGLDITPVLSRLDSIDRHIREQRSLNVEIQNSIDGLDFYVSNIKPAEDEYNTRQL